MCLEMIKICSIYVKSQIFDNYNDFEMKRYLKQIFYN